MVTMSAITVPKRSEEVCNTTIEATPATGYIAIGLRDTDRGLRMVRLFTTDILPREMDDEVETVN